MTVWESPTLPPVSVARTCTLVELEPAVMFGAMVVRLKGNETSLLTTLPLTSSSTFRTWTSSKIDVPMETVVPSRTWIPGIVESRSTVEVVIETVGGCP